jgi:drug/metabolite transporter (DMT)-like permease
MELPESPAVSANQSAARRRAVGVAMLVAASVLWSVSGVAVKTLKIPSISFTLYRSIGAAAAMALVAPFMAGRRPHWQWMGLSALLYTAVVLLLVTSMTISTAAVGILLQYTSPIWCALLAWLVLRRRIDSRTILAMLIATAGITVMIAGQPKGSGWLGPFYGLLSGIAFGALILVLGKVEESSGGRANSALIVLFNNLGVLAVLVPVAAWKHKLGIEPWKMAAVAGVGVIQLAVPYMLFQMALRRVQPVDASLLTLLEPVLNPVWVALATVERPDVATLIGGGAILVSLVLEATKKPEQVG